MSAHPLQVVDPPEDVALIIGNISKELWRMSYIRGYSIYQGSMSTSPTAHPLHPGARL
jgi:hypothetical protein